MGDEICSVFTLSSFKFSGVASNSILGNRYAVAFNVVYIYPEVSSSILGNRHAVVFNVLYNAFTKQFADLI